MGRAIAGTVYYTGARADDVLVGVARHNRGLRLTVKSRQDPSGGRVTGKISILDPGKGTYAECIRLLDTDDFDDAAQFIQRVQHAGASACTHIVNRNCLKVENNSDMSFGPAAPPGPITRTARTSRTASSLNATSFAVGLNVFLCHASRDKLEVRKIYRQLKADGIKPWLDEEDLLPGQDWELEIRKAVRAADAVVVCMSEESIRLAGYLHREIRLALEVAAEQPEGAIFLIPLRLELCEVPDQLRRWQWVDFFKADGYQRLLRALSERADTLSAIAELQSERRTRRSVQLEKKGPSPSSSSNARSRRTMPAKTQLFGSMLSALQQHYGTLNWWTRENKLQMCIEAILSQRSSWEHVGMAIANLEARGPLTARSLKAMSDEDLQAAILPCRSPRAKSSYIKHFITFLEENYDFDIDALLREDTSILRRKLLKVRGVGEFTCDNILLYAANKNILPINDRVKKVLYEHGIVSRRDTYDAVQQRLQGAMSFDPGELREWDAKMYRVAREYCHEIPECSLCPLKSYLPRHGPTSRRQ